ncbi:hypothetical protein NA56DRAFT_699176 [Hyaloscypha hepaticicola]|uniref:Uncharacterized protein n=1 Tax=Hyaloscypha hepaticicola TaxID=2082293 RepID=A0A2J6QGA8_9HELO|nr:hypothetical protein NA56DRAFT_699176 [Hyaloscypha hepaticicola]
MVEIDLNAPASLDSLLTSLFIGPKVGKVNTSPGQSGFKTKSGTLAWPFTLLFNCCSTQLLRNAIRPLFYVKGEGGAGEDKRTSGQAEWTLAAAWRNPVPGGGGGGGGGGGKPEARSQKPVQHQPPSTSYFRQEHARSTDLPKQP